MERRMPRARLIILSTGGTISMTKEPAPGGAATTLCAANLVAAVPRLADLAEVESLDVLAKPSADFTLADIAAIADAATAAAKAGAGVVITHGTDTLEESAFALSLLVQVEVPIVFTAAMRRPINSAPTDRPIFSPRPAWRSHRPRVAKASLWWSTMKFMPVLLSARCIVSGRTLFPLSLSAQSAMSRKSASASLSRPRAVRRG
jgi:hypothetical protein